MPPTNYLLRVDTSGLKILAARTRLPLADPKMVQALGRGVRAWGALLQARAVMNVSGRPVVYDGRAFRVNVQTGALKGSIDLDWPYGSMFRARVFVNGAHTAEISRGGRVRAQSVASYANAIEDGHKAIDLKQTMLGKTVPFFAAKTAGARGPFAARGLEPLHAGDQGIGSGWQSPAHNRNLALMGKGPMIFTKQGSEGSPYGGSGAYYISFRKVGRRGWIIPAAQPRPFMRAALQSTREAGRRVLVRSVADALRSPL